MGSYLSQKRVVNEGHVPQYYVEDSHPAIIPKEVFEAAQAEMQRRSTLRGYSKTGKSCYAAKYPFSGRLVCGHCGSKFTRKQWGKDKFVWMCINRMKHGVEACSQKAVKEPLVEQAFVRALNKVVDGDFAAQMVRNIQQGLDSESYAAHLARVDEQLVSLQKELMAIARTHVREGIHGGAYSEEHRRLSQQLESLRDQRDEVKAQELRSRQLRDHQAEFATLTETVDQFDGDLFVRLVEQVVVKEKHVVFGMKTGLVKTEKVKKFERKKGIMPRIVNEINVVFR